MSGPAWAPVEVRSIFGGPDAHDLDRRCHPGHAPTIAIIGSHAWLALCPRNRPCGGDEVATLYRLAAPDALPPAAHSLRWGSYEIGRVERRWRAAQPLPAHVQPTDLVVHRDLRLALALGVDRWLLLRAGAPGLLGLRADEPIAMIALNVASVPRLRRPRASVRP